MRAAKVMHICRQIVMTILVAALIVWMSVAPIVWILRDGLGSDMVETTGVWSVFKFSVQWGVPALVLVIPLIVLSIVDRRCDRANISSSSDGLKQSSRPENDSGMCDEGAVS